MSDDESLSVNDFDASFKKFLDQVTTSAAARPGRVDTAIEIPLPDATCRQQLFELYSKGWKLSLEGVC